MIFDWVSIRRAVSNMRSIREVLFGLGSIREAIFGLRLIRKVVFDDFDLRRIANAEVIQQKENSGSRDDAFVDKRFPRNSHSLGKVDQIHQHNPKRYPPAFSRPLTV